MPVDLSELAAPEGCAVLTQEIQRIGTTAQFNNIHLLDSAQTISFQVGANDGEVISVSTVSLGAAVRSG